MNALPLLHQLRARHAPADERLARRRALELLGLASAAWVAACKAGGLPPGAPDLGGRRVAVVGGGLAGLCCVAQLCWAGYDAMLFEARPRLGGRVSTLDDFAPGRRVEAGADFIGARHTTWLGLAQLHKLELVEAWPADLGARPIVLGGRRLDATESAHLYEELSSLAAALNALAADVDADQPWTHARAAELDARDVGAWIDDARPSQLARAALRALLESTSGVPPERMSLLALLSAVRGGGLDEYWSQSQRLRCKGGNDVLVRQLEKRVGATRMLLDTPVRAIRARSEGFEIEVRSGDRYRCAEVVLAIPPPTWARVEIDPPLPPELAPQAGRRLKLLAGFATRPFGSVDGALGYLGDGLVQSAFDPLAHAPNEHVHTLACTSGGGAAERLSEILEVERRSKVALRELDAAWPGTSAAVGEVRWCDWTRDPWSLGGCSFPAPGELTRSGALLRAGHGGIRFAGEYASSAFPGTMEGALSTGRRVARELCHRDGLRRVS
jgi:monoamine oxidase